MSHTYVSVRLYKRVLVAKRVSHDTVKSIRAFRRKKIVNPNTHSHFFTLFANRVSSYRPVTTQTIHVHKCAGLNIHTHTLMHKHSKHSTTVIYNVMRDRFEHEYEKRRRHWRLHLLFCFILCTFVIIASITFKHRGEVRSSSSVTYETSVSPAAQPSANLLRVAKLNTSAKASATMAKMRNMKSRHVHTHAQAHRETSSRAHRITPTATTAEAMKYDYGDDDGDDMDIETTVSIATNNLLAHEVIASTTRVVQDTSFNISPTTAPYATPTLQRWTAPTAFHNEQND